MSFNLSIAQALDVWADLEEAYAGTNGYGGDTAEIYAYRLAPANPSVYVLRETTLGREAVAEMARTATRNLYSLLRVFKRKRSCRIWVDGQRFGPAMLERPEDHRWHVRIVPRKERRR